MLDLMLMLRVDIFLLFENILFLSSFLVKIIASCRTIRSMHIELDSIGAGIGLPIQLSKHSQLVADRCTLGLPYRGYAKSIETYSQIRKIIGCGFKHGMHCYSGQSPRLANLQLSYISNTICSSLSCTYTGTRLSKTSLSAF